MNEEFHMLPKDRASLGVIKTFTPELVTTLRRGYSLSNLRADALAGLTVAIVGVPLAMALAVASGAKPEAGLFSAVVGGFVISARQWLLLGVIRLNELTENQKRQTSFAF